MITNIQITLAVESMIQYLSDGVNSEGLVDTPRRVVDFYEWFKQPARPVMTTFKNNGYNHMVIVNNIPFYSLCEHHLLPFFGTATIAYFPNKSILGLSKIPRLLDFHSRRLQTQEYLTRSVAVDLGQIVDAKGVAVTLSGRHLCMEMRGVQRPNTLTSTTHYLGIFESDSSTRQEYLTHVIKS